jgi:hypothetical protein
MLRTEIHFDSASLTWLRTFARIGRANPRAAQLAFIGGAR